MTLYEILKPLNGIEKNKVVIRFTDEDQEYNAGSFGFTDAILYNSEVVSANSNEGYLYILIAPTKEFYEE